MTETQFSPNQDSSTPGAPKDTFSPAANELFHEPHVSTASTGNETTNNNNNNNVYVYNVYKQENKLEALIHSRVPLEIKVWLQKLSSEYQETESTIIRKLLIAAYQGFKTPHQFAAPTVILNYNVAKAEARPVVNLSDYVARKELEDLLTEVKKLNDRAERERQQSGLLLPFTVEWAKKTEEALLKALKGLKTIDPEKLQEVEVAMAVLKGIRGGKA